VPLISGQLRHSSRPCISTLAEPPARQPQQHRAIMSEIATLRLVSSGSSSTAQHQAINKDLLWSVPIGSSSNTAPG
jgi:hypothetical protein